MEISFSNCRALTLLLALSWPFYMVAGPRPPDHAVLETKLQKTLQGKVAVLLNFYVNDELSFDSQGNLKGLSKIGRGHLLAASRLVPCNSPAIR